MTTISRIGGSPQHPLGNGLLSEQFPPERRGFAISAHISGGNVGSVAAALAGPGLLLAFGWRGTAVLFGIPTALIGLAMFRWMRESGLLKRPEGERAPLTNEFLPGEGLDPGTSGLG